MMEPGVVDVLDPVVRRLVAPNGGFMTGPGTNTYLLGHDEIAVIDPGPDDGAHLEAIIDAVGGRLRWILCTHTHPDHSPGAVGLRERTGAEVLAHSSRDGLTVDRVVGDGTIIESDEFRLEVVHTPGHAANHLCFMLEEQRLLLTGDHIVNGSTSVVLPPDGDMADYMGSLERVRGVAPATIAPGHGALIDDPDEVVEGYISHRLERERQILDVVASTGGTGIGEIVTLLYSDVPEFLHVMAAQSVYAHLLKLVADGIVEGGGFDGRWVAR